MHRQNKIVRLSWIGHFLFFILMQGAAASYDITIHYCDM